MKSARWFGGFVLAMMLLMLMLAGCASAPPETFYTLSSGLREAAGSRQAGGRTVVVARAALPELVDRPQLIVDGEGQRLEILEQQRWAEPLRTGIPRVVAENLGQQLTDWRVSTRDEAIGRPDCRVNLDVRRFRYTRATAVVTVDALWTVICAGGTRRMGETRAQEAVAGPAFDAVVAAHGRALGPVSRDIARALTEMDQTAAR